MPLQPAPATEPGTAVPPGETGETAPTPTVPTAPNPAAGLSPQRLYNQAYADFASGQWSIAIQGFQMFINTFPKSEQAATAQRNIGDAYSLDGKFDQAIAAYDKVISDYPTSPEVPMAYYKRGLAQVTLGQTDRARDSWDVVMKRYPDSEAAILAKQGLGRLKR
jgi:tol-pal system protein YbgF